MYSKRRPLTACQEDFIPPSLSYLKRITRKKPVHSPYKLLSFILVNNQSFSSVRMSTLTSNRASSVNADRVTILAVQP